MSKSIAGSILVKLGIDLAQFEKNMNQANNKMEQLGQAMADAGQQIGMAFGAISGAIGAGLTKAVKKAADFEQGLSNIKAVSGATSEEMSKLKELALQVGQDTKYGATEAAQGIEELIKAGVSMEDIVNGGLTGALNLATAGNLELAEAAEIASTALNAFKNDGLNVTKAADILAGAANASATSVQELKFGLSAVASVASGVGMSFEDTNAALAVFAQNGLKGSDAGTSLKTMLMNLQPKTKEQIALFKQLGITTADGVNQFVTADGKFKDLASISEILKKSMGGLSDAQRLQAMETMFGSDAIRAANILFKEGEAGVNQMKAAMAKVTAEEVALEMMNNLNGAIEQLKGAFDTFMISIGDSLMPAVKSLVKGLSEITDWFNSFSPTTKKVIAIILAVTFVITGLIAVVGILIFMLGALVMVEWAVVAPILLIIAKVLAVIAIFALLAAGLVLLYKKSETFKKIVDAVWNGIKIAITAVVKALVPIVKEIWDVLIENLKFAWSVVKPIIDELWNTIKYAFDTIKSIIQSNSAIISGTLKAVWFGIRTIITTVLGAISIVFKTKFNFFWSIVRTVFYGISAIIKAVFATIKHVIKNGMDIVKGIFKAALALFKGDFSGAFNAIRDTVKKVMQNVIDYLKGLGKIFLEAGKNIMNSLGKGIKDAATGVVDSVKGVAKKIRDFFPFSPAKTGPLSDIHKMDFAGPISKSIEAGAPDVQARLNSMLTVPDVNSSAVIDGSAGTTVIMQLDSKTIAKKTFEQMGGVFRLRGAVT
jgi:TP901 family phage tail tape measure protein